MLWLSDRLLLVVVALVLDAGAANASGTRYVPAVLSRLDFIPTEHGGCMIIIYQTVLGGDGLLIHYKFL